MVLTIYLNTGFPPPASYVGIFKQFFLEKQLTIREPTHFTSLHY